jgi:hypothetical protein
VEEFSHANATPCTDGERVYAAFASGVVVALDYTGKVVWRKELIKDFNLKAGLYSPPLGVFGLCSSPVLYKDMLIVDCASCSVAFDCKTGAVRYSEGRDAGNTYPSPVPAIIKGAPWLLHRVRGTMCGINPENGKRVWFVKDLSEWVVDSLGVGNGIMFTGQGTAWELDSLADATGDISAKATKWKLDKKYASASWSSPLISGGYLYYLATKDNKKALLCVEAATGNVIYEEKMPDQLASTTWMACPFATADGLIYFAGSWRSVVVKAGPKFEVVAINDLDDGGSLSSTNGHFDYNSAAVSEGKIFVEGYQKIWCIGKK